MLRLPFMPTDQILSLLIDERDRLNRAIQALQHSSVRRGRPAKNVEARILTVSTNGRRGMSATARKAQSARMKAYWAKRRKLATAKAK